MNCKRCGGDGHFALDCTNKSQHTNKPINIHIKSFRDRTPREQADLEFRRQWIQDNPPPWVCYLQISALCLRTMQLPEEMTLEHVIPKSKGKQYRYDKTNIKAACDPCNTLKGSRSLESLIKQYPHIQELLDMGI